MQTKKESQCFFLDASSGQMLDERLVKKARLVEMQYFKDKNVYTKVTRDEAFRLTGRAPIAVKWVDVNKGDDEEPNYRSRLVAKDFKKKGETASSLLRLLSKPWGHY